MVYLSQAPFEGPGISGGTRVKTMIGIFRNLGIRISLISYSFYSDRFRIEHKTYDSSFDVTTVHTPKNYPKFLKFFAILPIVLYASISSKDSDIIFADLINVLTSFPAVFLKLIYDKPLILDFIDITTGNIIDIFHRLKYSKNADCIFAISHYLLTEAKENYNCKTIEYMPISVDTNKFKLNLEKRAMIRQNLGFIGNEIIIGYAGSFWSIEGVPNLIYGFNDLCKKYPQIRLAIMGDFELNKDGRDNIPKILEEIKLWNKVVLIPSRPHEEIPDFLSAFDILCCPKLDCKENRAANPAKVIEYMSMGIPTIASAVGEINFLIEDKIDGFLVKPGNINDLKDKLELVLNNLNQAKIVGKRGREKVLKNYSYSVIEDAMEKIIIKIMDNE